MICPNCGKEANFREHSDTFTERHGLECGPYEQWTETWLTCSECGAKTDDKELREAQPVDDGMYSVGGLIGDIEDMEANREKIA